MKVFGLQTFIWQNNIKSALLMLMFPFILTVIVLIILFSVFTATGSSKSDLPNPNQLDCIGGNGTAASYRSSCLLSNDSPLELTLKSSIFVLPLVYTGVAFWFLIAWAFNRKMITSMSHAKLVERKELPEVYNMVENLCISRGLPVPKIYIIEDDSLNAFASGLSPKDSFIAFSRGIINKLDKNELEAVAAHELTHIMNRDTRLMLIAIIFVGIIQTLSEVFIRLRFVARRSRDKEGSSTAVIFLLQLAVFVLGFVITALVQLAISRKREFLADAGSVELTKTSKYLKSALQKISSDPLIEVVQNRSIAQMFIDNPMNKKGGMNLIERLFSTHPSLDERLKALDLIG